MKSEIEIDEQLKKLDEKIQKVVGDNDNPPEMFRQCWLIRTTLLWAKEELEDLR